MEFLSHTASDYERALREVRSHHGGSVGFMPDMIVSKRERTGVKSTITS